MYANHTVYGGGVYATAATTSMGRGAEVRFMRLCDRYRYEFKKATRRENMVDHFDFHLKVEDDAFCTVEVKAMKSRRRSEPVDPSIIYLETRRVGGGVGWLYGKADYIAFEQPNGFLFVERLALASFVQRRRPSMLLANRSGIANTLYSLPGRGDEVAIFNLSDIVGLCDDDNTFLID